MIGGSNPRAAGHGASKPATTATIPREGRPGRVTFKRGAKTRTLAIRPVVAGSAIGVFVLLLTAYVGATAYLVYRDDLIGAAVSRQVSMQYAYEERIAALRSELDRLTSRHAVQTEGVEQQLARLLEQQDLIQSRQAALDQIVGRARAAGVDVAVGEAAATPPEPPDKQPPRRTRRSRRSATFRLNPAQDPIADMLTKAKPGERDFTPRRDGAADPFEDRRYARQHRGRADRDARRRRNCRRG